MLNGNTEIVTPIPYNKQDNKSTDTTLPTVEGQATKKLSYKDIYDREENLSIKDALVKFVNYCRGRNYTPKVTTVETESKLKEETPKYTEAEQEFLNNAPVSL